MENTNFYLINGQAYNLFSIVRFGTLIISQKRNETANLRHPWKVRLSNIWDGGSICKTISTQIFLTKKGPISKNIHKSIIYPRGETILVRYTDLVHGFKFKVILLINSKSIQPSTFCTRPDISTRRLFICLTRSRLSVLILEVSSSNAGYASSSSFSVWYRHK